jgi:hypothetical protein
MPSFKPRYDSALFQALFDHAVNPLPAKPHLNAGDKSQEGRAGKNQRHTSQRASFLCHVLDMDVASANERPESDGRLPRKNHAKEARRGLAGGSSLANPAYLDRTGRGVAHGPT